MRGAVDGGWEAKADIPLPEISNSVKKEIYSVGMSEGRPTRVTIMKLAGCCLLAGVVVAALMFPLAGGLGLVSNRASDIVANGSAQLLEGDVPQVTTMVDAAGDPIAWLYSQRRFEVPTDQIANTMKLAIVSIEDKRFAEHSGVDWQGTLTGLSGYLSGDRITRGGSTIEQQYVKGIVKLFGNGCGAVDVSGLGGER